MLHAAEMGQPSLHITLDINHHGLSPTLQVIGSAP